MINFLNPKNVYRPDFPRICSRNQEHEGLDLGVSGEGVNDLIRHHVTLRGGGV